MSINNNRTRHSHHHNHTHQCPCAVHDAPAIHEALDRITHYHTTHSRGTDINKWVFTPEDDSIPLAVVYVSSDPAILQAIDSALKSLNKKLTERPPTRGIQ